MTQNLKYLEYYRLKDEKKASRRDYDFRLIELKRELHNEYKQNNKWKLRLLDIIFVFSILFNIGAMVITNAMVLKENPNEEFKEVNPIMAEANNYVEYEEAKPVYFGLLLWLFVIGIMLTYYIYNRAFVFNHLGFVILSGQVWFWFLFLAFDFFNDFGYWIGKVIYG